MKKYLPIAVALAALLALAPAAGAVVYVEGTGEPAFTNTTTNTQWVRWQGSSAYESLQARVRLLRQLGLQPDAGVVEPSRPTAPARRGSTGRASSHRSSRVTPTASAPTAATRSAASRPATPAPASTPTRPASAPRPRSTAPSRRSPSRSTAAPRYSRTAKLDYQIDYSDNLAFPFPANFLCRDIGTDPATACQNATHGLQRGLLGAARRDEEGHLLQLRRGPLGGRGTGDVPVTLCVMAADAADPGQPELVQPVGARAARRTCRTASATRSRSTAPRRPSRSARRVDRAGR